MLILHPFTLQANPLRLRQISSLPNTDNSFEYNISFRKSDDRACFGERLTRWAVNNKITVKACMTATSYETYKHLSFIFLFYLRLLFLYEIISHKKMTHLVPLLVRQRGVLSRLNALTIPCARHVSITQNVSENFVCMLIAVACWCMSFEFDSFVQFWIGRPLNFWLYCKMLLYLELKVDASLTVSAV
jgi:hypothetical protein